jgi:hypothetical protein
VDTGREAAYAADLGCFHLAEATLNLAGKAVEAYGGVIRVFRPLAALSPTVPYRIGHPPTLAPCGKCGKLGELGYLGGASHRYGRICGLCVQEFWEAWDAEEQANKWADFVAYPGGALVEVASHDWFEGPEFIEFAPTAGPRSYASVLY